MTASAADNVGVIGVQFFLDSTALGSEDASRLIRSAGRHRGATNGSHSLTARARDAAGNQKVSASVTVTVSNGDTTAPTISITAPGSGATVSGTTSVAAAASDNVRVVGVQFFLDGNLLGNEDTWAPYSISWTTSTATNGSHSLTARARDAAGNQKTSAPVTVTVSNGDATTPT